MTNKHYKIWLIVTWSDIGAVWITHCALSYQPEQWFADMWTKSQDDYANIVEFTTNLSQTDSRLWHGCTVTHSDYNDNECWPTAVSDVGFGDIPVITAKPNGERMRFQVAE